MFEDFSWAKILSGTSKMSGMDYESGFTGSPYTRLPH